LVKALLTQGALSMDRIAGILGSENMPVEKAVSVFAYKYMTVDSAAGILGHESMPLKRSAAIFGHEGLPLLKAAEILSHDTTSLSRLPKMIEIGGGIGMARLVGILGDDHMQTGKATEFLGSGYMTAHMAATILNHECMPKGKATAILELMEEQRGIEILAIYADETVRSFFTAFDCIPVVPMSEKD